MEQMTSFQYARYMMEKKGFEGTWRSRKRRRQMWERLERAEQEHKKSQRKIKEKIWLMEGKGQLRLF